MNSLSICGPRNGNQCWKTCCFPNGYHLKSERAKNSELFQSGSVENLTSMIEPIIIVFLGVVIGGLVIAMYMPIFSMASGIG